MHYELVEDTIRVLTGEILTIIDASTEGAKNKAMKDLVKKAVRAKLGGLQEYCFGPNQEEPILFLGD